MEQEIVSFIISQGSGLSLRIVCLEVLFRRSALGSCQAPHETNRQTDSCSATAYNVFADFFYIWKAQRKEPALFCFCAPGREHLHAHRALSNTK
jgi:hypothetical protein